MTRARDVSNTQASSGGPVPPMTAGKNVIINGDFNIWQRGTSFNCSGSTTYTADRTANYYDGTGATVTVSRQSFTPGAAPVAGYEGAFFYRFAQTVAGSGSTYAAFYYQPVEDVRTLAGQTVTLSFWAKSDASRTYAVYINQFFGSGGSSEVVNSTNITTTTGWVRYSYTVALGSLSGKTIGTNSLLSVRIEPATRNITQTLDIWGVQLEAGPTATPFETATGTLAGELAACQRYLPCFTPDSASSAEYYIGYAALSNVSIYTIPFHVQARVAPTGITVSGTINAFAGNTPTNVTPSFDAGGINCGGLTASHTITLGQGARLNLTPGARILFTGCEL